MTPHILLQAAALILLIAAALFAWRWRPDWDAPYSHTFGWAGLACWLASTLF